MLEGMRCGTFAMARHGGAESSERPRFGADVAHSSLMTATLKQSPELGWDLLGATGADDGASTRIRACDVRSVSVRAGCGEYLLVCSLPEFGRMAQLRGSAGLENVPICILTHSLWTEKLAMNCIELLLHARPCDRLVTSSQAAERVLRSALESARSACGRDHVVQTERLPFGVTLPEQDSMDRGAARRLLSIPVGAFVPIYLGRISEAYKADLTPLLICARHLRRRGVDCYLLLAGAADDTDAVMRVRELIGSLGLEEHVRVLENFPEFIKSALFAAADVFVSPADSVQETLGIALLEAMAHRLPVVASSWSGYRDLVVDGVTGFLARTVWSTVAAGEADLLATCVPRRALAHRLAQQTPTDTGELLEALTRLASSPELAENMGKAGRQRVAEHYASEKIADRFLALWAQQLASASELTAGEPRPQRSSSFDDASSDVSEQIGWFATYASRELSESDLLVRLVDVEEIGSLSLLRACGCPDAARMEWLLARTAVEPLTVGELMELGFAREEILWPAKKGLRRIVSQRGE